MIDTPEIVETEARDYAYLHLRVPKEEIRRVMGPGLQEVYAVLGAQGIEPSGPWFTHHLKRPDEEFNFEICVPVSAPIEAQGNVEAGIWPAMRVARTVYRGGYEGLAGAWGEFEGWIAASGLKTAKDLWEQYLSGPETSREPARWRTELNRPLVD